jgi:hypothetical protein
MQFWKSNAMHWCDLCKCWMNDTKAAKLNHERGAKHQENLARSELSVMFGHVGFFYSLWEVMAAAEGCYSSKCLGQA